jgi:uncharacterized RDD family membrane protein YckC
MFGHARKAVELAADAGDAAGGGELRYAGFWARVAALIVDNAIVALFGLALVIGASSAGDAAALGAMVVCALVVLLYWPLLECSAWQATLGKQLLGIQVTDLEGGRLSFVRSLLRNLAKIVSLIPLCIGFLLAGFTARKQALHDMIVSCLVVRSGPSHLFRAVAASVLGLIVIFGGMAFYTFNVYLPQQKSMAGAPMQSGVDKGMQVVQPSTPAATPSAPVPEPQPATAAPPASQPVLPVAVMTPEAPPATAPAPVPAPKPAAAPAPRKAAPAPKAVASAPEKPATVPAAARAEPAKLAAVEVKPAPATPAAATPAAKQAAPAVKPKPKPAPTPAAELVSEPPADKPQPVRRTAAPRPAADVAAPVPPAPSRIRVVVTPKYNDVMTAVMYLDAAGITQLLDLGWWVDRPDTNGVSPLMAAAWIGDAAIVQLLLQRGADPNRRARSGSVFEYAGRSEDSTVIELVRTAGAR